MQQFLYSRCRLINLCFWTLCHQSGYRLLFSWQTARFEPMGWLFSYDFIWNKDFCYCCLYPLGFVVSSKKNVIIISVNVIIIIIIIPYLLLNYHYMYWYNYDILIKREKSCKKWSYIEQQLLLISGNVRYDGDNRLFTLLWVSVLNNS